MSSLDGCAVPFQAAAGLAERPLIVAGPSTGVSGTLVGWLESLLPVRFSARSPAGAALATGVVDSAFGDPAAWLADAPFGLIVPRARAPHDVPVATPTTLQFADDPAVPWPFRSRRLGVRLQLAPTNRPLAAGETVLASDAAGRPLWTLERRAGRRLYRSALLLPDVAAADDVDTALGGDRFVQALPLFHLLREAGAAQAGELPPLRASFIVDDPNLHWPTYGFADYRQIARHAERDDYHVAFATIPFDAWFTHLASAAIFRAHPRRLSLLVHGNDHGRDELAQPRTTDAAAALLRQALARIERLEAKAGLRVCRVMVPPHGACAEAVLGLLPRHGFEAACVSAGSLRAHNPGRDWTRTIGLAPSERIAGCPVLPRWSITGVSDATLLAAAYLGQALVLRGHHQDLRHGTELFASRAGFINSLGSVRWLNMTGLSRQNVRRRRAGRSLHVELLGNAASIDVPADCDEVIVDAAAAPSSAARDGVTLLRAGAGRALRLAVTGGETIAIRRHVEAAAVAQPPSARPRHTPLALVARRLLSETRDRLSAVGGGSSGGRRLAASPGSEP